MPYIDPNYEELKKSLINIGADLLQGSKRYLKTGEALPDDGISVVHMLDQEEWIRAQLDSIASELSRVKTDGKCIGEKFAFVKDSAIHATTFNLLNRAEDGPRLANYGEVEPEVEQEAIKFVEGFPNFVGRAEVFRINMLRPNSKKNRPGGEVTIDLDLIDGIEDFQRFRQSLLKQLNEIDQYKSLNKREDESYKPHVTIAYLLRPFEGNEIEAFVDALKSLNKAMRDANPKPHQLELSKGSVMGYNDMDDFNACRSGETLMEGTIRIKLVRSPICTPVKHKRVVKGLGLRKLNQVVERPDTPGFRGMVKKVPHLLQVVE